jgi:glycine hydroxymethyltransferase
VGTPAATSRGLLEDDMRVIAKLFKLTAAEFESKADYIRGEVDTLCKKYPLYD